MDGHFDVIGTGTLLGVKGYGKESGSIPVGYETVVDMSTLDFEEFLWANSISDAVIDELKRHLDDVSSVPELPLGGNAIDDVFKVYMRDMGLFVRMLENGTQYEVLQGNLYGYKGAIFENLVANFLTKMGRKLYYYRKDLGLEINFVIRWHGACTPVEAKAARGDVLRRQSAACGGYRPEAG